MTASLPTGGVVWKTAFELSPILLVNGIASFMPFNMLPIVAITEAINMPLGLLSGTETASLDDFFAHWKPMPGSSLIDQDLARYPFANSAIAANAVIANPLLISMQMTAPARGPFGMFAKLGIMTALQFALQQHNAQGGTYVIATPSKIYLDCVMRAMRDVSQLDGTQPQQIWQLDFEQPLLTLADAQQVQNAFFQKITNGGQVFGAAWSGLGTQVSQAIGAGLGGIVPTAAGGVVGSTVPATGTVTVTPLPPLAQ